MGPWCSWGRALHPSPSRDLESLEAGMPRRGQCRGSGGHDGVSYPAGAQNIRIVSTLYLKIKIHSFFPVSTFPVITNLVFRTNTKWRQSLRHFGQDLRAPDVKSSLILVQMKPSPVCLTYGGGGLCLFSHLGVLFPSELLPSHTTRFNC